MKHNLFFKTSANYQNESVCDKGNLTTVTNSSTRKKLKRVRSAFTTDQLYYLEKEYKKHPYIGTGHRKEIATALNISERTIKIWFQNRRMKEKKETISKEFCDEQTGRRNQQVEFAKNRLNNVITVQSTNGQSLNSLSLFTPDYNNCVESTMNKNVNVERHSGASKVTVSKYFRKSNIQKNKSDPKMLSFLKSRSLLKDSTISAQSSVGSSKKYMKINNNIQTKSDATCANKQSPGLKMNNSYNVKVSPQDLTKKSESKISAEHGYGIPGYVPMVPNFYPQSFVTPGGVLWKPVNLMSVTPKTCPTISRNEFNTVGNPEMTSATKMCNCNCHLKSFNMGFHNIPVNPQYVLTTLPFQNPSTKF